MGRVLSRQPICLAGGGDSLEYVHVWAVGRTLWLERKPRLNCTNDHLILSGSKGTGHTHTPPAKKNVSLYITVAYAHVRVGEGDLSLLPPGLESPANIWMIAHALSISRLITSRPR